MDSSSIGGVGSVPNNLNFQQRAQSFRALDQALQSGDLAGAQKAFAGIQQPGTASKAPQGLQNDFAALSSALQSGDLSAAQKAFATLQADAKTARAQHHKSGGASGAKDADGDNDGSTSKSVNVSA